MLPEKLYVVLWNGNSFGVYVSFDDANGEIEAMESDGMHGGYIEEHILEKEDVKENGFKGYFWLFDRTANGTNDHESRPCLERHKRRA